jgi:cytochrome P450
VDRVPDRVRIGEHELADLRRSHPLRRQQHDLRTTPTHHRPDVRRTIRNSRLPVLKERRAHPADDLCSAMPSLTEPDGTPTLSDDEVLAPMVGLTAAGDDTTTNLITNMVRLFSEHPDQRQLVLDEPTPYPSPRATRRSPAHRSPAGA